MQSVYFTLQGAPRKRQIKPTVPNLLGWSFKLFLCTLHSLHLSFWAVSHYLWLETVLCTCEHCSDCHTKRRQHISVHGSLHFQEKNTIFCCRLSMCPFDCQSKCNFERKLQSDNLERKTFPSSLIGICGRIDILFFVILSCIKLVQYQSISTNLLDQVPCSVARTYLYVNISE